MSDLVAALQIAIKVHADQREKSGEPYLLHVLRVVESVGDEAKVVAALHDVPEDYRGVVRWQDLMHNFGGGLSLNEAQAVELLTRQPGWKYAAYVKRIAEWPTGAGPIAREVKLADLRDNLGRIPPVDATWITDSEAKSWASLKARYEKAIATLEAAT